MIEIEQHLHATPVDIRMDKRQGPAPAAPAASTPDNGQRGAVSIMFSLTVLALIGFVALALDLSLVYNRRVELQSVADAAAIAAARELTGTGAGVTTALSRAAATANSFKFRYHTQDVGWSDAAIKFSSSGDAAANWVDASAAVANPDGLLFAKVDTSDLDPVHDTVDTVMMGILSDALATTNTHGRAVAGRSKIRVTPLAICAMSTTPASQRNNPWPTANSELEEFGFRRGVSYDLMNLNPNGSAPENFVINPIDPIGTLGSAANTAAAVVGPFVCAGSMPMPRVMGANITVGRPFPIGDLFQQLNSRFDQYNGALCSPEEAPPDANIRAYNFNAISWMSATPGAPGQQSALSLTTPAPAARLTTVASVSPAPTDNTAPRYGPLWSFARAVPYANYVANPVEPANGYATFPITAWNTLYRAGCTTPSCVPAPPPAPLYSGSGALTPYMATGGPNFLAPSTLNAPGLRLRRVLNVPLLECPVTAGTNVTANVLGIGRFFMTVPATSTTLHAEFAGAVREQSLGGRVELVR